MTAIQCCRTADQLNVELANHAMKFMSDAMARRMNNSATTLLIAWSQM